MNKILKKALEVLVILALGIGLAACGKETETDEPVDEYGYISVFKELKTKSADDGYVVANKMQGDILHYIYCTYKEEQNGKDYSYTVSYEYHKYNITDGNDVTEAFPEGTLGENEYLSNISINDDETMNILVTYYDNDTYESQFFVKKLDGDLKVTGQFSLSAFITSEDNYIENILFADDGSIYLATSANIMALSDDGKLLYKEAINGYVSSMVAGSDGKAYFVTYDYETWKNTIKVFDVNAKKLYSMDGLESDNIDKINLGMNNTIIYSGDTQVKCFNPETKVTKDLWNWFEVDAADATYGDIFQTGEDSYSVLFEDYSDEESKTFLINIRKELLTEENRRTNLSYGCTYLDSNIKRALVTFNRGNDKYRIIPVVYQDLYSDYEEMFAKYEQDVKNGKLDVFDVGSLNVETYIKEGCFEDLSDYYSKAIDSSKYNEKFLNAFDYNGKKYYLVYTVGAETLVAPKSVVGNKTSITLNDLFEIRKKYPNIAFFEYGTKSSVFYTCFYSSADSFLDYEKGTCNFTGDTFIQLLEFANTFPESIDYENYDSWDYLKNGEILFSNCTLDEVSDFQIRKKLMGDDIVIIGLPTESGSGTILYANDKVAISSKSKYKDEAWLFLKTLLEEDVQKSVYSLPILKSAIEAKFEEAATPNKYTDFDGVEHEYPKTTYSTSNGDEIEIYAATKEEIDQIRKAFENVSNVPYVDDDLYELMSEELDSYFKGGKSAKEVAEILQSRVKIFLAERY